MAFADVWVFRIVHQDTGKPAQGVPVTVLDKGGNAAGHWVSDADGIVAGAPRGISQLRARGGVRRGEPVQPAPAAPGAGPAPPPAPPPLPPPPRGGPGRA